MLTTVNFLLDRPGMSCPWHAARETYGYPNLKWCEQALCSIIEEPANTWSNLGYLIVALLIIYQVRKHANKTMLIFAIGIFLMGSFSFIYHATNNWNTQILDFIGMYFYTGAMIFYNFKRAGIVKKGYGYLYYIGIFLINMLLIPLFHNLLNIHIQLIVAVNVVVMLAQEFWLRKNDKSYDLKFWWLALITIAIAESFSILDVKRIMCSPENHIIQGHAIWHVVGSVSNYFTYLFYRQFVGKKI